MKDKIREILLFLWGVAEKHKYKSLVEDIELDKSTEQIMELFEDVVCENKMQSDIIQKYVVDVKSKNKEISELKAQIEDMQITIDSIYSDLERVRKGE